MKALIKYGYKDYLLPAHKALEILEVLEGAELWDSVYHAHEDIKKATTTYHAYPAEGPKPDTLELIPDDLYRMAKLAGRPEEK
jgi:hypothetical protein